MTVTGCDGQIEIVTSTIACNGRMRNRAKTRAPEIRVIALIGWSGDLKTAQHVSVLWATAL